MHKEKQCTGKSNDQAIVFGLKAEGFHGKNCRITISEWITLVNQYPIRKLEQGSSFVRVEFDEKAELLNAMKVLQNADLGVTITVTGAGEEDYAVSIRKTTPKLPEQEILEITTMCGHGMISQHLTRQILIDLKRGKLNPEKAANILATPCMCGVFNQKRAQRILEELAEIWCYDEL